MPESPECPRCGYDLSGEAARWAEACPLEGVCSECGYAMEWRDVLVPARRLCFGLVEHAQGSRQLVRWTWTTALWLVLPWVFWRRVKLHHEVRLRRVFGVGLLLVAALHLASGAIWAGLLAVYGGAIPMAWRSTGAGNLPFQPRPSAYLMYARGLLSPVAVVVPNYFTVWDTSTTGGPPALRVSASAQVVVEWFALPLLACCAVGLLVWPLIFAAVPWTRGDARVSWAHIWRALGYSLWSLVAAGVFECARMMYTVVVALTTGFSPWRAAYRLPNTTLGVVAFLISVWVSIWWFCAMRTGWKLRRAAVVWLLLQVCVGLAAAVAAVLCWLLVLRMRP